MTNLKNWIIEKKQKTMKRLGLIKAIYQTNSLEIELLFISYKFVKGFLAIIFYYLFFFFELKLSGCVSTFFIQPETKFQLDMTKDKEFPPWTPIIKIAHFCNVMSIDMTSQK